MEGRNCLENATDTTDVTDEIGHGTAVAGVIAASADSFGIVGVAHKANIIPFKVAYSITNSDGTKSQVVEIEAISRATYQAMNFYDADVINYSIGITNKSETLKRYINNAIANNIIVVASSGNISSTFPAGTYTYPAAYDGVISVGNLAYNSSTGEVYVSSTSQYNDQVTVCAPGTSIYAPNRTSSTTYSLWTGTSFSCPYVAGIAALAKSIDPDITPAEFTELLIKTADKELLEGEERTDKLGYGVANAGALVEAMIAEHEKRRIYFSC